MKEDREKLEKYPVLTFDFFNFLFSFLPPEGIFSEDEMERKFKAISRGTKKVYPDYCRDSESWIKSTHNLLFYDFLKSLLEPPQILTPGREWGLSWLFDRFSLGIDKAEEQTQKKKG